MTSLVLAVQLTIVHLVPGAGEIRFKAPDVVGLPDSVRQRSWNITTAQPVGYHARTIGEWFDDQGQPMDQAAVLLSDRGAFYSHVVLTDDRDQKKQMLAALLGHLAPALWQQMADGAIQRCSSDWSLHQQFGVARAVAAFRRSTGRTVW